MALQTAGLLCSLIFLISSIFEVLIINNLYVSQHGLIGVLLVVLALWAWLEVALFNRQERSQPVRSLNLLLGLQIGLIMARHWTHFTPQRRDTFHLVAPLRIPELSQALVFMLVCLVLFLAISRCLINAFATGERLRANQLEQQNLVLQHAQDELKAAQASQHLLELQQRAELEQKLKTSLTAAAVVHEIQQPLSSILLNCRSVEGCLAEMPASALPEPLQVSLNQLSRDGDRVVATMERMRMLLRNVETAHTPIDLSTCVDSALLFLKNILTSEQVKPLLEGFDQPCPLDGDRAQLQMAVVNLIRNALQAMEAQPPTSRKLLLRLQRHRDRVELSVEDSGPGFPDAYRNDTSWELLKSTKATGMGIGLFIAQTAASNHRGQLRIGRSTRLGGAEVVINLPAPSPQGLPS